MIRVQVTWGTVGTVVIRGDVAGKGTKRAQGRNRG